MYSSERYSSIPAVDSKNVRLSNGFLFNGQKVISSGFKNDTTGTPGGVMGTCFHLVEYPSIQDSVFPTQSETLCRPVAVDLLYRFTEQDVVLMESAGTELIYSTYTLGEISGFPISFSASAIVIECQPKPATPLDYSDFESTGDYFFLNNTTTEANFPFEISYSLVNVRSASMKELKEWPTIIEVDDLTDLVYENCSIPQIVKNDSVPTINKLNQTKVIMIKVKLVDNVKAIIDNLITVTGDTLFRIILNPIFVYHTSVAGKSKVLFPLTTTPVEEFTHILFSTMNSTNSSPTHYRVVIKDGETIIVDGVSTGEFSYNPVIGMIDEIRPFVFKYVTDSGIFALQEGQIRYDGNNDTETGAPKYEAKNILVEINESLSFKLRNYSKLSVEVYVNDGVRSYHTNLWSI